METSKSRRSPGFNSWTTVFLVYINDIYSNLSTNVKLFADYNFLFSIWNDANESFENVSNDICITNNWAYRWKMSVNPDRSKQAPEVIFSRKIIDSVAHCFNLRQHLQSKLCTINI